MKKLSNKILIAFFGFIFIYLTAAFAEIRFRGNPVFIDLDDTNSLTESVDITGVTYLILPDIDNNIKVIGSDQPQIEVRSISGELLQKLKYNISGDTLTLSQLDLEEDQRVKISIYVPRNGFSGMTVNGAVVTVEELEQKVLSVSQNAGQIRMDSTNILGKLHLEASNGATFYITDTDLHTLSAQVDSSKLRINSKVKILEGIMKNDSYIRINSPEDIHFKKDESSILHIY